MSRDQDMESEAAAALSEATDVVHQRSRLSIMGVIYELGEADFVEIRTLTRLSDGNLSRHLQVLEEAQLVSMKKGFVGKRPRTVVRMTARGKGAFEEEIEILKRVVAGADAAQRSTTRGHARGAAHRRAASGADVG